MNDGIDFNMIRMTRSMMGDVMQKRAFVPSGDPSMGGAPPGGAPPMDPAMMGGAPPMDPAMMGGAPPGGGMPPGMDPAMMGGMPPGGAPPMDPAMMGGAPPPPPPPPAIDPAMIQQMVDDAVKKSTGGAGAGVGGGGGLKPKIDVNVELMQIKHMLARLADALNVKIPAQDLVATPDKLMAMANGGDSGSGGGGGGAGAIPPIGGISGITPAGTPGGEKSGYDLATTARNIRQNLIHPTIKQAEAAGQAISLPMFSTGGRAASIAAVRRKR